MTMMSDYAKEKMFHRYRKEIRLVKETMKDGSPITLDVLMEKHGWCRTKAWSTLQAMWMLGVLSPQK